LVRLIRYKLRDTISAQNGARGTAIDRAWREEKALVEVGGVLEIGHKQKEI
jgi:hypothetical protein